MSDARPDDIPARRRLEAFARLFDEAFTIPGTRIRVGWDGIIGLLPGIGDLVTTLLSLYPVFLAIGMKQPPSIIARMLANVGIDAALGAVPFVGDLFDFAWKSNRRNADLLERALIAPRTVKRESRLWMAVIAGLLLGIVASVVIALAWAAMWVISILGWLTSLW